MATTSWRKPLFSAKIRNQPVTQMADNPEATIARAATVAPRVVDRIVLMPDLRTYSPTNEPSGAMMKSDESGEKARQPMSSIDPITRMLACALESQKASISNW